MKIAVATDDSGGLSRHFGRSKGFVVFTVQDKNIIGQEMRENRETAFAQGQCKGDHKHHEGQGHSHAGIVEALSDCDVVCSRTQLARDLERPSFGNAACELIDRLTIEGERKREARLLTCLQRGSRYRNHSA